MKMNRTTSTSTKVEAPRSTGLDMLASLIESSAIWADPAKVARVTSEPTLTADDGEVNGSSSRDVSPESAAR
jgi:hypothetical protein